MAEKQSTPLHDTLSSWLPSKLLRTLVDEEGVVQCERRFDPVALLWGLVWTLPSG